MEVFTVGGAVRDELMGLVPKDIDYVVVGATPAEMIEQGFSKVGADFPVFLHPVTGDEYALARTERKIGNGYHGFAVDADPSTTLADDLSRRDLTINAMAKDAHGNIHDPFNGQADMTNKVLRHVSPAFAEDPLRVVRLARFFARYSDFSIATETLQLARIVVNDGDLNHLPHERFWAELVKVFHEKEPWRFFEVITSIRADTHVKFFNELYGAFDRDYTAKADAHTLYRNSVILRHVVANSDEPEERLMIHTALTAIDGATLKTAPSCVQNLFESIERVRALSMFFGTKYEIARKVFNILKHAKAFGQGTDVLDLIFAIDIMNAAHRELGLQLSLGAIHWEGMLKAARSVVAADFPEATGKELGNAIMQGRINAIEKYLENVDA